MCGWPTSKTKDFVCSAQMFKKRAAKGSKAAIKTSFHDEDDVDEEQTTVPTIKSKSSFLQKKARERLKRGLAPPTSSTGHDEPLASVYTESYLEELRTATPSRLAAGAEVTEVTTESIALDDDDSLDEELKEEQLLLNELEIDEGAGFEDEELAIGSKSLHDQSIRRRLDIANAIDELSESDGEEANWEQQQITSAGRAAKPTKSEFIPEIVPIPDLAAILDRLTSRLEQLHSQKSEISTQIATLQNGREILEQRESDVQHRLDLAAADLEKSNATLETRKSVSGSTVEDS